MFNNGKTPRSYRWCRVQVLSNNDQPPSPLSEHTYFLFRAEQCSSACSILGVYDYMSNVFLKHISQARLLLPSNNLQNVSLPFSTQIRQLTAEPVSRNEWHTHGTCSQPWIQSLHPNSSCLPGQPQHLGLESRMDPPAERHGQPVTRWLDLQPQQASARLWKGGTHEQDAAYTARGLTQEVGKGLEAKTGQANLASQLAASIAEKPVSWRLQPVTDSSLFVSS